MSFESATRRGGVLQRPVIARPTAWEFPAPAVAELDNGMQLQVFNRPGQHLINATLVLDLPLTSEAPALEGVSALLVRCLDEGTRGHPGTAFAEELESCGAVFSGGTSHSAAHLGLEVPSTRFGAALPLFVEAAIEPQLASADVRRQVDLRLAQIAQQRAHPTERGAIAFRQAVIDDRFRAARPTGGEAATVAGIGADDVRDYHAGHYGPERATLVLSGDFGQDDPVGLVRDAFGGWAQPVGGVAHETPRAASARVLLIDRPGAVQADVRIGRFGIDRLHPDYAALRLGTFVLGGGFLSRLNRVLREERGYTYGVQLSNAPARSGGLLALHASCRTDVAVPAITEALDLLRVDGTRALTPTELEDATNYLVGIMPLRCATASGIGDQVAGLIDAGLDAGFVNAHTAALQAVTAEQATDAVARHLPPDDLTLVVVGDAGALADGLRAAGLEPEIS